MATPAPSYRVEVYDRGAVLWRAEPTDATRVELPPELVDRLPRGEPILWRVFVRRGVEEEALGLHTFEIAPADG